MSPTRRTLLLAASLLPAASLARPALAQGAGRIRIGYTAVVDYAGAFIAHEEGFFRRRGLETELQLIALNSNIPAALQSNSVQIGGPTPSVMISAVDGGLDLVAVAACAEMTRETVGFGVVTRAGLELARPADFHGRRVGVPGINAFLQVLFRKWMMDAGADPRRVTFVEVAFPQMPDVMRGGTVDAVVTADPFMSRIVQAGIGRLVTHMAQDLAEPLATTLWSTTRAWAGRNADAVRAFREGLAEAVAFSAANPDRTREHIATHTRLPIEVVRSVPLARLRADVTQRDLEAWVGIMQAQDMLTTRIDAARLRLA